MWIICGIDSIVLISHTLYNICWKYPVMTKLETLTPTPHVAVIQWIIWEIDSLVLFSHKLERGSSLTKINGEVFLSSVFTSPLTLPPSPQSPENFLLGEKTSLFHFQSPLLSSFCLLLFLLGGKKLEIDLAIRGADKENDSKHISILSFVSNSRSNILVVFIDGAIQDYCICIFIAQVLLHYLKCHYFSISSPQIFSIPSFPRKKCLQIKINSTYMYLKLTNTFFPLTIFLPKLPHGRWTLS